MQPDELKKMVDSYLDTALWSSTGENCEPLDDDFCVDDIDEDSVFESAQDCEAFFEMVKHVLAFEKQDIGTIGHDFWLTRNGHGAGFWDGDYINGDKLTEFAKTFGSVDMYVGDDNKVYIS